MQPASVVRMSVSQEIMVDVGLAKVKAVNDFQIGRHSRVTTIRSFLGLCNGFRKFIKDFENNRSQRDGNYPEKLSIG